MAKDTRPSEAAHATLSLRSSGGWKALLNISDGSATAKVLSQASSCGICGGHSCTGAGLLRVLLFPLPVTPPTAPRLSSSRTVGTVGQTVAEVASGLHPKNVYIIYIYVYVCNTYQKISGLVNCTERSEFV
jgi:hypothetical protein